MDQPTAPAQADVTSAGPPVEVTQTFYNTTAREWIRMSSINKSHGREMLTRLDGEYEKLEQTPQRDLRTLAYATQLNEVYKIMGDAMMSAVHRGVFHYHVNYCASASGSGYHIPTDEEELQVSNDPIDDTDEDDNESLSSVEEQAKKPAVPPPAETKARKREEAKKRRAEDDELLIKEHKVRDEKNNLMATVGPFPPPRLTIRSLKPGRAIPSRKSLTQRAVLDNSESSSDSEADEASTPLEPPGPSLPDVDTVAQLMTYLSPLSMDSLKKMSESAKVKFRGGCSHDEAVSDIVKAAVKMGCEKACVFMDKNKMLDKVATHANTTRAHVLAQLATSVPSFLKTLPDDLLRSLGPTLGIPHDSSTVPELWERIVAMGFCAVLTHLRPRPLKKIAQELTIQLNDSASTEKHCEQIVFTAFPRERLRVRHSRSLKKAPGVCFRVVQNRCRCQGDMGFIDFAVLNVSSMRQDNERHYSPEFEFANLRWSLLCMSNKDALALYLCQQGTVHCKFIISILNHIDPDSTVYNEGTQRFSSASAENDWGFNNVVKFEYLLDPKNGFWSAETDQIVISVGIVLVEANQTRTSTSVITNNTPAAGGARPPRETTKTKGGATKERIVESVANQLLETERLENLRKKVKADLVKTQKEEEKQRKDWLQKQQKGFQQLLDQHNSEKQRITKDIAERERKEQQERMREQERLRQLQEQNDELKRKVNEFTEECGELANKKKAALAEIKDERRRLDALKTEVVSIDAEVAKMAAEAEALEKLLADRRKDSKRLRDEIEETRAKMPAKMHGGDDDLSSDTLPIDTDILRSVQQSLAGIVDADW
jgi:hypothetical protein